MWLEHVLRAGRILRGGAFLRGGCLSPDDALQVQGVLDGSVASTEEQKDLLLSLVKRRIRNEQLGVADNSIQMAVLDRRIQEVAWMSPSDKKGSTQPYNIGVVAESSPRAAAAGESPVMRGSPSRGAATPGLVLLDPQVARCYNSEIIHVPERFDERRNSGDEVQCKASVPMSEISKYCPRIRVTDPTVTVDLSGRLDLESSAEREHLFLPIPIRINSVPPARNPSLRPLEEI